jgi:hypothetical protein
MERSAKVGVDKLQGSIAGREAPSWYSVLVLFAEDAAGTHVLDERNHR